MGSTHRAGMSQCLASLSHIIYKVHTHEPCNHVNIYIHVCIYNIIYIIYPPKSHNVSSKFTIWYGALC